MKRVKIKSPLSLTPPGILNIIADSLFVPILRKLTGVQVSSFWLHSVYLLCTLPPLYPIERKEGVGTACVVKG